MNRSKYTPVKDLLKSSLDKIELLYLGNDMATGLKTGFQHLDNLTGGLERGNLIVLASIPFMGKTALALDIARHVASKEKKAVGIMSLNLSREVVVNRLIANQAKVDLWKVNVGRLSENDGDFSRIDEAVGILRAAPIFIYDLVYTGINELKDCAIDLKSNEQIELLIVNGLELIICEDDRRSIEKEMVHIIHKLKDLAVELGIPIIATTQLADSKNGRPSIRDSRFIRSIQAAVDVIIFLHGNRINSEGPREVELSIAKNKTGPTGTVKLNFDPGKASFAQ